MAHFLKNYTLPISMINEISLMLHNDKQLTHGEAGMSYLKMHPEIYHRWFKGVKTANGKPALPAFETYLNKA